MAKLHKPWRGALGTLSGGESHARSYQITTGNALKAKIT